MPDNQSYAQQPGDEVTDMEFFDARVALAIAASRVEATRHPYPFNNFTGRTTESATAGDVTQAMRYVADEGEASKFIEGYVEYMVFSKGYGPEEAREVAVENLRRGSEQSFSDTKDAGLLALWRPLLR